MDFSGRAVGQSLTAMFCGRRRLVLKVGCRIQCAYLRVGGSCVEANPHVAVRPGDLGCARAGPGRSIERWGPRTRGTFSRPAAGLAKGGPMADIRAASHRIRANSNGRSHRLWGPGWAKISLPPEGEIRDPVKPGHRSAGGSSEGPHGDPAFSREPPSAGVRGGDFTWVDGRYPGRFKACFSPLGLSRFEEKSTRCFGARSQHGPGAET